MIGLTCMIIKTALKRPGRSKSFTNLKKEVEALRSLVISFLGEDPEGSYKPKFVKEMLEAVKERPSYTFTNRKSFLAQLKRV